MDVNDYAEQATEQPPNSGWFDDRLFGNATEDPDVGGWGLTPFARYDSCDELSEANFRAARKALEDLAPDDVDVIGVKHWAGSVRTEQLIVRVYRWQPDGTEEDPEDFQGFTEAARWVAEAVGNLEVYPVLDEEVLSEVEHEAFIEAIESHIQWDDNGIGEYVPGRAEAVADRLYSDGEACYSYDLNDDVIREALVAVLAAEVAA